jgi:S-adenosylmethionine hydrolase
MSVIALLTDFGLKDGFVGTMKGVILSINSSATIVDISHDINSFDILEGALVLKASYKYFPKGSVFVVVVDPGVGTERKAIVVETEDYYFVAPDNGVLTLALENEKIKKIVEITNEKLTLKRDNETFHGRDIFAPVSAHISNGIPLEEVGKIISNINRIDFPKPKEEGEYIIGEIIKFDKFGNGITNIEYLSEFEYIEIKGYKITKVAKTFLDGEKDKPNIVKGSFGFYEIFIPLGSAKDKFNLKLGEKIKIRRR